MRSRIFSADSGNTGGTGRSVLQHDCRVVLKECLVPVIFGIIIFCILLPGSTAALPDSSVFNLEYTHDQLKFRFFEESMLLPLQCAAVLFGGGLGLRLFSFLADKKKSAFVLSLGLKRRKLFAVRAGMGFLSILISIGIPVFVSWCLNRAALGGYREMGAYAWNLFFMLVLQSTVCMLAASAACSIAGTASEAGVLAATLLAAPSVILFSLNAIMKTFLWGNVFGETTYAAKTVEEGLVRKTSFLNPLLFSRDKLEKYNLFMRAMDKSYPDPVNWKTAAVWFLVSLLLAAGCAQLFRCRKAENAGMSGLSRLHNQLIRIIWPLCVFGLVMEGLRSAGHIPSFAAACGASVLMLAMIDLLFSREKAPLLLRTARIAVFCLCLLLAAGLAGSGLPGYGSRIPKAEQIESVRVTFPGVPALMTEAASSVTSGKGYYSETQVSFSDSESIERVRELHREVIEERYSDCGTAEPFEASVFPYDVCFCYTLSSGRTMTRYYDRIRLDILEDFLSLDDSPSLRTAESKAVLGGYASILWNSHAFADGKIYYTGAGMNEVQEILTDEEHRAALLQALAEDLQAQTLEDRYFPDKAAEGILYFTLNGESDTEQFRTSGSNARIDLTGSFAKTAGLLAQWGLSAEMMQTAEGELPPELTAENIESITIQKFDPFASMNRLHSPLSLYFQSYRSVSDSDFILEQDFGTRPSLTDPEQIGQLLPGLRNSFFMSGGGYFAAVKIRGSSRYTYMFLPSGSAPDFLRTKMG